MRPRSADSRQRGIVLLLAMLFAVIMAAMAASALRVAVLEQRMAANASSRMLALELADSIMTNLLQESRSFPLSSAPGVLHCPDDATRYNCKPALPEGENEAAYVITRLAPALWTDFEPREAEYRATGAGHFHAAVFKLEVTVGSAHGRAGRARIVQGVAVRAPAIGD